MSARYAVPIDTGGDPKLAALETDLNAILGRITNDMRTKIMAKADLPTDGSRTLAIVSDEVGGSVLAFWDETNWRRVTDRAVVS